MSGSCAVDSAGCITSPNYDPISAAVYPTHSECAFDVKHPCAMEVEDFNVENFYDFLIVNNEAFSGSLTPHGKVPATASKIQWVADYSVEMTGFKICPRPLGPCDQV